MNTDAPEISLPPEVLRKWQRIVDLLADVVHVPSAVVTQLDPPDGASYRIVANCALEANPFRMEERFSMDIGTFCETVIKKREPLLVANWLEDDQWRSAPEMKVGMVSYLGYPVLWPDGRVFGTICVLDDKTNRYSEAYQELLAHCREVLEDDLQTLVRLGSELEEQRAHLSELFARVPEAVVMVHTAGRIARVNPEFTKIFGYTAEEAIGRRIADLITPDEMQEEVDTFMHRLTQEGQVFAVETVRRHKDGRRIPVSLICVPVTSNSGTGAGYLIYRDVSEARRFQEEQRRYHEMQLELAQANRMATLGQLSASIAHELNQPLTGIITNCGTAVRMLSSEPVNVDGAREAMQRTMRDGNRASDVVARLRSLFSRRERMSEPVNLNEATQEVIALMHTTLQAQRVAVTTDLDDRLPLVDGDRVQLQQVVLNLIQNAVDAMAAVDDRPRALTITTRWEDGDRVCLHVKDVGAGFAGVAPEKLFEAFYSTKDGGMGVGLSICRSIVEAHEGRLWGTPNAGPGATFAVSLPRRVDEPETRAAVSPS